jgi:CHRD domain
MNASSHNTRVGLILRSTVATIVFGGMSMAFAASDAVTLSGNDEVPAVTTSASGSGAVKVADDKTVSGSVTTKGITATAAHIHEGEMGKNGPVVIALTKSGDDKWVVPDGAKFSDAQYESYKAGKLYVNVHSAAHKDGEIRGQLKP